MTSVATLVLALVSCAAAQTIAPADRRSSYELMSPDTQRLQDDETQNPGMLWVLEGEGLWTQGAGGGNRSCAACHGRPETMKGVAARYPLFDAVAGRVVSMEGRINLCRTRHQKAAPFAPESKEMLALSALIGLQSRGVSISVEIAPQSRPAWEAGRALFTTRMGQLDLSCAQCHEERWGRKLAGVAIPQAHPTGYPLYRLEWQGMGSLARRFRNCMIGVRAEPFALDGEEYVALELYLKDRAKGMKVETPAVRP